MSQYINLNLRLTDPNDSQAVFRITSALVDMINGLLLPIYAAEIVDEAIRADLEECHQSCRLTRNPTPQQLESGFVRRPRPDNLLRLVWTSVALIAMRVPPDHRGQGFLVQFLQELSQLPLSQVPQSVEYSHEVELGYLWTENTFRGFRARILAAYRETASKQRQGHDAAAGQRYVNFSAFISQLLVAGILDPAEIEIQMLHRPAAPNAKLGPEVEGLEAWPSVAA